MFKKNDFIEIDFTALIKETNLVFETTSEEVAKKNNFYNPKQKYSPKIICIGSNQLLPGLEKELENKEIGKEYEIELSPEKAFGKKNPKLLQLISLSNFKKQNINPYPGMQVNIDNLMGIVRTVSGGRVIVDFNHPLSGRTVIYKIRILRQVNDPKEKISSIVSQFTQKFEVEIKESEATIKTDLPEPIKKELPKLITRLVPIIKKITIVKE
ncbi:MAG: peptidylprolyl isomerase [Nanoarchaeota archaeon]|nr:peptidylprolyl isomerase [Nanoarchaeota archaeon]